MKVLIPDDWDGEDWQCITLAWPNSAKWTALLAGLVTAPTRGRWYEETSGNIKDAQAVGMEIFNRNIPFSYCEDSMPEPERIIEYLQGAGIVVLESDEMGQVVTDVQIVGGKLRVFFGPCCYHDLDVVSSAGGVVIPTIPQPGDDDEIQIPEGSPLETTSACAKASRVVFLVESIVDEILDGAAVANSPSTVRANLEDRLPGINFGSTSFLAAYVAALNIVGQGYASETEDPDIYQAYRFAFNAVLSSGAGGVTADEYAALKSALNSVVNGAFDVVQYPTAFSSMRTIHQNALWMIGENDIRNQTSYIAATGNEDCGSPIVGDEDDIPVDATYWLGPNLAANVVVAADFYWRARIRALSTSQLVGLYVRTVADAQVGNVTRRDWTDATEPGPADISLFGNNSENLTFATNGIPYCLAPSDAVATAMHTVMGDSTHLYHEVVAQSNAPIVANKIVGVHMSIGLVASNDAPVFEEFRFLYST